MPDLPATETERSLLDAIVADPASDAARLAYADAVESRDPELAELIRVEIRLKRGGLEPDEKRSLSAWDEDLKRYFTASEGVGVANFDRGFLRWTILPSNVDAARAEALFERNPLLTSLNVWGSDGDASGLAGVASLARVVELSVSRAPTSRTFGDEQLATLLASPNLTGLTSLVVDKAGAGVATAHALARSTALDNLRGIYVADGTFDSAAATALADRPRLPALTGFSLSGCAVHADGVAALCASTLFRRVTSLRVYATWVMDEGARAVAGCAALAACAKLEMPKAGICSEGAKALAASPHLGELVALDLTENGIGDEGARALAASTALPKLERLLLQFNGIGEEGIDALVGTQTLGSLRTLGIDGNALYTDEIEQWTDWDGTPVGSGPVRLGYQELKERYKGRFEIL